jgi:hypothetical protein
VRANFDPAVYSLATENEFDGTPKLIVANHTGFHSPAETVEPWGTAAFLPLDAQLVLTQSVLRLPPTHRRQTVSRVASSCSTMPTT